jgi:hypothetical protein
MSRRVMKCRAGKAKLPPPRKLQTRFPGCNSLFHLRLRATEGARWLKRGRPQTTMSPPGPGGLRANSMQICNARTMPAPTSKSHCNIGLRSGRRGCGARCCPAGAATRSARGRARDARARTADSPELLVHPGRSWRFGAAPQVHGSVTAPVVSRTARAARPHPLSKRLVGAPRSTCSAPNYLPFFTACDLRTPGSVPSL